MSLVYDIVIEVVLVVVVVCIVLCIYLWRRRIAQESQSKIPGMSKGTRYHRPPQAVHIADMFSTVDLDTRERRCSSVYTYDLESVISVQELPRDAPSTQHDGSSYTPASHPDAKVAGLPSPPLPALVRS